VEVLENGHEVFGAGGMGAAVAQLRRAGVAGGGRGWARGMVGAGLGGMRLGVRGAAVRGIHHAEGYETQVDGQAGGQGDQRVEQRFPARPGADRTGDTGQRRGGSVTAGGERHGYGGRVEQRIGNAADRKPIEDAAPRGADDDACGIELQGSFNQALRGGICPAQVCRGRDVGRNAGRGLGEPRAPLPLEQGFKVGV